jgi:integrase
MCAIGPCCVHLELAIAARAFRLARSKHLIANVPEFPRIGGLHVRQGFVDPAEWERLRAQLSPDFRDAADFAFLCGPRQMEALSLTWAEVEPEVGVINLRKTKTGRPRAIPYAEFPELAAVIERRAAVREQLKRAAVVSPWVFCFAAAGVGRPAGLQLFERAERKSGERGFCKTLRKQWRAAAVAVGHPGLLFHDLRRTAVRIFERSIPDSSARAMAGHTERFRTRYGARFRVRASGPRRLSARRGLALWWQSRKKLTETAGF